LLKGVGEEKSKVKFHCCSGNHTVKISGCTDKTVKFQVFWKSRTVDIFLSWVWVGSGRRGNEARREGGNEARRERGMRLGGKGE